MSGHPVGRLGYGAVSSSVILPHSISGLFTLYGAPFLAEISFLMFDKRPPLLAIKPEHCMDLLSSGEQETIDVFRGEND